MRVLRKSYRIIKFLFSMDKRPVLLCLLCMLLETTERILRILLPAYVIQLVADLEGRNALVKALIIISVIALFGLGTRIFHGLLTPFSFCCSNLVQARLKEKLMKLSIEYSEQKKLFEKYQMVNSTFYHFMDTDYILINDLIGGLIVFFAMSFLIWRINPVVYFIVFAIAVFLYVIGERENKVVHELETGKQSLYSERKVYLDMLYDTDKLKEIRLYQANGMIEGEYRRVSSQLVKADAGIARYRFRIEVIRNVVSLLRMVAIYLNAIREYVSGKIEIGVFYVLVAAGDEMVESVASIVDAYNCLREVTLYYDDYEKYMNEPEEFYDSEKEKKGIEEIETIEFRNVTYRYPSMDIDALKGVSCTLRKGESIAVIGDNGAGKTTFVKLLLQLYRPTEGVILVNGQDIRDYKYDDYLRAITTVFQDTKLTAYSVLENIVLDSGINMERVHEVCKTVGIDKRISETEKGVESIVSKDLSEEGIEFSGGECQKIAIARALYRNASALVLDEPTASLDPLAERDLFRNICDSCRQKLLVFITHRLSNVTSCDRILLFQNGEILAGGMHQELMHNCELYKNMFDLQAKLYFEES